VKEVQTNSGLHQSIRDLIARPQSSFRLCFEDGRLFYKG